MPRSVVLFLLALPLVAQTTSPADEALLAAARKGDLEQVKAALAQGANLEAKTRYGVTPLYYAASHGQMEVLRLLLEKGANVNVRDTFYKASAVEFSFQNGHLDAAALLIEKGAAVGGNTLQGAVASGKTDAVKMLLAKAKFKPEDLSAALGMAEQQKKTEIAEALKAAGARPAVRPDVKIPAEVLASYAGLYRSEVFDIRFEVKDGKLFGTPAGQSAVEFIPLDPKTFQPINVPAVKVAFQGEGPKPSGLILTQGPQTLTFKRVEN